MPEFGQVEWERTNHILDDDGIESEIRRDFEYDDLGRLKGTATVVREDRLHGAIWQNVSVYEESTIYDDIGRVFQHFDASGDNRGQRMVFNEFGYLESIREAQQGLVEGV